ncbi:Crp/Fnr family transcriptional regulator [Phyllobacterium zundukense]|uniref:Crp/Fnr family transcriptional regulator n=1 Tax=Phyllobacterium zundukense TaxID=1867719 RepID=A0A2N9VX06_9HYPH|nr:Crp/Fnr family transcriptional regulator [Phyllobacterium zundukense]ATU90285.1 Crp/Fnr family transcriptional regulator [Phyllobacterium zundukense]PIO44024.1 Crp/Fnr family transcriptional regulator [Phyllobacterium zundukense]
MKTTAAARQFPCEKCPLQDFSHFQRHEKDEVSFLSSFKMGELVADTGTTVLVEGANSAHLFTVLSGWGFRYKTLDDGRRQILNYVLPGDLIGLQGSVMKKMQHSIEALSPMILCMFQRDNLANLFRNFPALGYDITWLASREEQMLDEILLSVGRRTALERAAYLFAFIFQRAQSVGMVKSGKLTVPVTQQHVADTLGLSIVHTNKTLKKLASRGALRWLDRGCEVLDEQILMDISGWQGLPATPRPYI